MMPLNTALAENHKDLYQWFLLHQECLLLSEDDLAQQAFAAFSDLLQQHIHFENTYVLAELTQLNAALRWPQSVYLKEHEKILKLLAAVNESLQRYSASQGRVKRLCLLELLEQQQTLRNVLEHHEEREEQDLLLALHSDAVKEQGYAAYLQCELQHASLKQRLKAFLQSH